MEGMMSKWQIGPVKLANGEEAFIDAINEGQDANRYTGRVRSAENNQWVAAAWHLNGRYAGDMFLESNDLLNLAPPPKKTVRVKVWVNVYADGLHALHYSTETARAGGEHARFALIEIDREVEEGEGLE
jgi:hypothetical protein